MSRQRQRRGVPHDFAGEAATRARTIGRESRSAQRAKMSGTPAKKTAAAGLAPPLPPPPASKLRVWLRAVAATFLTVFPSLTGGFTLWWEEIWN